MKYIFLLTIYFVSSLVFAQANKAKEKDIEVVLGIDKVEKLNFTPSGKGIQIGNESVLTYELLPQKREMTFKGLKSGKTSVIIRDTVGDIKARYLVKVTSNSLSKTVSELKEFLGDIEGLDIGVKGGVVFIGGELVVPHDYGKIAVVLERYPDVLRLVELSPMTQRAIAKKMQEEIQRNNMRNVTVRVVNKQYWLEGSVASASQEKLAIEISKAYLPDGIESLYQQAKGSRFVKGREPISSFISVETQEQKKPIPKIVKVITQFVELTKDYGKIFGFSWSPTLGADGGAIQFGKAADGGLTTNSTGTLSGTISNLMPKLASAKNAGYAREIQSGMILVKNGQKATINKDTETPYDVGQGEFTKGDKAQSGFDLQVKPSIIEDEQIELAVGLGVGIVTGFTTDKKPVITKNKLSTTVIVKSKESAVIGGIVIKQNKISYDKDPPGGSTDGVEGGQFLFSFIRSRSYLSSKTQHVVFVTPEIVASASAGTEEIKKKFRKRRNL
ncbi:MAG: hypothetical protein HOE90_08145 [Bacteriovoracaceae bacterium]|jgi:pilus assembly protein CpaC|nr:hypothetical protein [Bacteriovoracaceae bacterium]